MTLPNANRARVDRVKIRGYLLCPLQPDGRGKAEFFLRFGFRPEAWEVLAHAPRDHGQTHRVTRMVDSAFGTRYAVEGALKTPDGRNPWVRSVWVVEGPELAPRLVTTYPIGVGSR